MALKIATELLKMMMKSDVTDFGSSFVEYEGKMYHVSASIEEMDNVIKEPVCKDCGQSKDVHPWACPKFVLKQNSEGCGKPIGSMECGDVGYKCEDCVLLGERE